MNIESLNEINLNIPEKIANSADYAVEFLNARIENGVEFSDTSTLAIQRIIAAIQAAEEENKRLREGFNKNDEPPIALGAKAIAKVLNAENETDTTFWKQRHIESAAVLNSIGLLNLVTASRIALGDIIYLANEQKQVKRFEGTIKLVTKALEPFQFMDNEPLNTNGTAADIIDFKPQPQKD